MKRFAFALGVLALVVLALGFAADTPARADFGIVRFELGYCRIYWNPAAKPWGAGWTLVATAPDISGAWAAQDAAVKKGKCK